MRIFTIHDYSLGVALPTIHIDSLVHVSLNSFINTWHVTGAIQNAIS